TVPHTLNPSTATLLNVYAAVLLFPCLPTAMQTTPKGTNVHQKQKPPATQHKHVPAPRPAHSRRYPASVYGDTLYANNLKPEWRTHPPTGLAKLNPLSARNK